MTRRSPYQGLVPYSEEDFGFFFGRDTEREIIGANLSAFRLTLLYGASGVGKTSVLHAGVIHDLRDQTEENINAQARPEFVPISFSAWREDPAEMLKEEVRWALEELVGIEAAQTLPPANGLADTLETWAEHLEADLLIVLDQFEEFFLYHRDEPDNPFVAGLAQLVNSPEARVHFLISIRDDALALLDRFKGHIPTLFDNYLRVSPLDREAAKQAIERPLEEYNRHLDGPARFSIEPELVTAVLDGVEAGRVTSGAHATGLTDGLAAENPEAGRIETAYLQLVMSRLWERETSRGSQVLTLDTLEQMGGTKQIVEGHVDSAMAALGASEQEISARAFRYLVTPSGNKIAHSVSDLAEYTGSRPDRLEEVLERLSQRDTRILRPVSTRADRAAPPSYEIRHDLLARAVLDWGKRRADAKTRRRIRWIGSIAVGLALALIGAVTVLVFGEGGDGAPEPLGPQPQPVATIEVGKKPQGLTVGEDRVWVASTHGGAVDVIDPTDVRGGTPSIAIEGQPAAVAVGFGSVWAVDHPGGSLLRLEPDGGPLRTIDVGKQPSDVAVDEEWVWVTNEGSDEVSRVDPETSDVDNTVPVGDAPRSVATGHGAAWVTNIDDKSVSRIDARTAETVGVPIEVGQRPNDLAVGEGYVWVIDNINGTLSRIDPESDQVVGDPVQVGPKPRGVTTGFGYVWVANEGDDTVARVDPESSRLVGEPTRVGADPSDVALGAGSVWTSNADDSTVTRIDPGGGDRAAR